MGEVSSSFPIKKIHLNGQLNINPQSLNLKLNRLINAKC
jgi:hypothetical protein